MMALEQFMLFGELSTEIRHHIWRLSLEPRIVEFHEVRKGKGIWATKATARLPPQFSVSRDSQQAVQYLYPRRFAVPGCDGGRGTRLNLAIDIVYFPEILFYSSFFLSDFLQKDLSNICYLAVDFETGNTAEQSCNWNLINEFFNSMPAIQELTLLTRPEGYDADEWNYYSVFQYLIQGDTIMFFDDIDKFPSYGREDVAEMYYQIVPGLSGDIPPLLDRATISRVTRKYIWRYSGIPADFKFRSSNDDIRW